MSQSRVSFGKNPVKALSIDGGGIRGLAALVVLEQLMEKANMMLKEAGKKPLEPWQMFDIIGGTSTGGLIAVMLGRLRMSVKDCITAYMSLSEKAFSKMNILQRIQHGNLDPTEAHYDTQKLEEAILGIIKASLPLKDPRSELFEDKNDDLCRVLVVAHLEDTSDVALLRTYTNVMRNNTTLKHLKIWEACRATSAARTFFDPIDIRGSRYSDGGFKRNNPAHLIHIEAAEVFRGRPIELISIGTGVASPKNFAPNFATIAKALSNLATETEDTAQEYLRSFNARVKAGNEHGAYLRFSADFTGDIGLDEWKELDNIQRLADRYTDRAEITPNLIKGAELLAKTPQTLLQDLESDGRGMPRLNFAASFPNVDYLKQVLHESPPGAVNAVEGPPHFRTPLSMAVVRNLPQNMKVLLEAGADTKARVHINGVFWPPLFVAAALGCSEAIEVLIKEGGLDPDERLSEDNGNTALHVATLNRKPKAVQKLLELGADPSSQELEQGLTPLDIAIGNRDESMMGILLQAIGQNSQDNRNFPNLLRETELPMGDSSETITTFCDITSATPERAREYLLISDGILEQALELFFNNPDHAAENALAPVVQTITGSAMQTAQETGAQTSQDADLKARFGRLSHDLILPLGLDL